MLSGHQTKLLSSETTTIHAANVPVVVRQPHATELTSQLEISPVDVVLDDVLINIFSCLGMEDLISASQVCVRWRTLALATASVWCKTDLAYSNSVSLHKFECVVQRSKQTPIRADITANSSYGWSPSQYQSTQTKTLREFLEQNSDRLTSLKLRPSLLGCTHQVCALSNVPVFRDAIQRTGKTTLLHNSYNNSSVVLEIPDMRKLDCMIHHMLLPACAMILPSVTDLQLVDFHSIERATMDRLYKMYPNITSLKLHATNKLPYFENANVLGQFLEHMSQLDKLSISQPLPSDYPEYMLAILGWPVKTIEIDVTNAGNGYQRQAQRRLRENIMPRSIVAIRCSRGRTTDGIWLSQYTVTLQLREGRSWIFTTDNFPRAMQNFAAPFLRETQVDEVVLDGHAAFAMFYSATRGSALGHIRTIRAVVDGPDSIRVPQQDVNVRGLEKIVLETRPEHGSRISASTLAKLVSKLKTDKRPDLYLGDTFVYDDEGTHEIGQYANIVDGQVRKPSWKIVTP